MFGYDCELIKSSGGVFEVTVEGRLIFSKKAEGRFPDNLEIFQMLGEPPRQGEQG